MKAAVVAGLALGAGVVVGSIGTLAGLYRLIGRSLEAPQVRS